MAPSWQAGLMLALAIAAQAGRGAALVVPPWNFSFPNASRTCVDATAATAGRVANRRFAYWSLPPGPAPAAGWPVFVSLATSPYHSPGDERACVNGIPRTGLSDGEKLYVKSKAQTALGAFLALGLGLAALANRTALLRLRPARPMASDHETHGSLQGPLVKVRRATAESEAEAEGKYGCPNFGPTLRL